MKYEKRTSTRIRINRDIRVNKMRLIDDDGKQLGIKTREEALQISSDSGLDLVEIAPQADPPVCRVMDYGKYRYEQSKKEKLAKKKQHSIKLKEIKMTPRIDKHDYEIKLKKAVDFLSQGNKVKITIRFRGREILHKEFGREVINHLVEDAAEFGALEGGTKMAGRNMSVVVSPKSTTKEKG